MNSRLIQEILTESSIHPNGLRSFVEEMSKGFGATHCGLISIPADHLGLTVVTEFNGDPAVAEAYERYYASINPWRAAILRLAEGEVATDAELCDPTRFRDTEFYVDFGKRFGVVRTLGVVVTRSENETTFVSLDRAETDRPYEESARETLAGLRHLIQSSLQLYRANEMLGLFRTAFDSLPDALAVLRADGRMVYSNRSFAEFSGEYFMVGRNGTISARAPYADRFRRALAATVASGIPSEFGFSADAWISIMPQPNRSVVIRLRPQTRPKTTTKQIAEALRLSPAEARLVERLFANRTLVLAAEEIGIATGTAKTQLRSVFAKTGCNSQKELLLRIARL